MKTRINKHKMILVMDLDETMVFTRRKKRPAHLNFREINVTMHERRLVKKTLFMLSTALTLDNFWQPSLNSLLFMFTLRAPKTMLILC